MVLGRHNLFLQNNVQFVKSSHIYWYSYFGLGQMDTTYIPMRQGFVYLTAVLDWASRRVLAWRVSFRLRRDTRSARTTR